MIAEKHTAFSVERQDSVCRAGGIHSDMARTDQDIQRTIYVSGDPNACTAEYCSGRAICVLELQPFCVHHFITVCFERLRLCSISWCLDPAGANSESNGAFIRECIMETAKLLRDIPDIDPVRRGHLLDVFLWASELASKRSVTQSADAEWPDYDLFV